MRLGKVKIGTLCASAAFCALFAACAPQTLPMQQDTDLLKAVRRDDAEAFDKALSKGQANTSDMLGRSPLMLAAGEGRDAFAAKLVASGAKLDVVDIKGQTALHFAASSGNLAIVKALLDAGANPSAKDSYGWTPLTEATRLGNVSCAKALLDAGAKVDSKDRDGKTPLMHAAFSQRNSLECVKLLLDAGADPSVKDGEDLTALMWAIRGENIDSVVQILSSLPSLADEREFGLLAMQWAIKTGNSRIVEILIEKGVPLNLETSDFTRVAKKLQAKGVSKVFANYGLLPENRTPLMWAAIYGQPKIAALLIARGSDVKARDNKGNTALDYAKDYATSKIIRAAGGR